MPDLQVLQELQEVDGVCRRYAPFKHTAEGTMNKLGCSHPVGGRMGLTQGDRRPGTECLFSDENCWIYRPESTNAGDLQERFKSKRLPASLQDRQQYEWQCDRCPLARSSLLAGAG